MPHKKKSSSGNSGMTPAAGPAIEEVETASPVPITVVIGASAGGLEALEQFFAAMPADSDLCFVVIMHHPPDGPSLLTGILDRYTRMEVVTAAEEMPLRPNTVCVIPPAGNLILSSGRFKLDERSEHRRLHHPIDLFFRT